MDIDDKKEINSELEKKREKDEVVKDHLGT
jgi:hypothetical protein